MVFEPFMSSSRDIVRPLVNPYTAIAETFMLTGWYARTEWLRSNAAIVAEMKKAIYDTARWVNGNHTATAALFAQYSKMDVDLVSAMTRATYATSLDARLLQPVVDLAVRYHAIERAVPSPNLVF